MSDSRFHLEVKFNIYGKEFTREASLNWAAHPGECDERISEWFVHCYNDAYADFQAVVYREEEERRKIAEEVKERQTLARLKEKYPD
jgi:hypothetical protein